MHAFHFYNNHLWRLTTFIQFSIQPCYLLYHELVGLLLIWVTEQRLHFYYSQQKAGELMLLLKDKGLLIVYDLPSLFSTLHKSQFGHSSSTILLILSASLPCH